MKITNPLRFAASMFAVIGLATGALAQQPQDIVGEAATAIVAQNAEALKAMRFAARDFQSKPMAIAAFLDQIDGCELVAEHKRGVVSMAHQIHYICPNKPTPSIKCASDILVVAIDRASSPDVTAFLRYQRLDTPECELPAVPVQG